MLKSVIKEIFIILLLSIAILLKNIIINNKYKRRIKMNTSSANGMNAVFDDIRKMPASASNFYKQNKSSKTIVFLNILLSILLIIL